MKRRILLFGLLVNFNCLLSQNLAFQWANPAGSSSNFNADIAKCVATDASGNVFTAGYFNGTVDFDPGLGTTLLTSSGSDDIFITKVTSTGSLAWAKKIGSTQSDIVNGIDVDNLGNVYITGSFRGVCDFDPSAGVLNLTAVGQEDSYVCRLSTLGNLVWAKQFGGTAQEIGNSISIDAGGNVYTCGEFMSPVVDFDPSSTGTYTLASNGAKDIYLSKLDGLGNFIWARAIGSNSVELASDIRTDASGNVFLSGSFESPTVDFDPGATSFNVLSKGLSDAFLLKVSSGGNFLWVNTYGSSWYEYGRAITIDPSGNPVLTGEFSGTTVDFDPSTSVFGLFVPGLAIFATKVNSNGNFLWAKCIYGNNTIYTSEASADNLGNIYIVGKFGGTVDFNPGPLTFSIAAGGSVGNLNTFILALDGVGNFVVAKTIISTAGNEAFGCDIDPSNRVLVAGTFQGTADFNPDLGINNLTSNGYLDAYTLKLSGIITEITESEKERIEIKIYPNPNNGNFTLVVPEVGNYTIINSVGQIIHEFKITNEKEIVVSDLADGVYYLIGARCNSKIVSIR